MFRPRRAGAVLTTEVRACALQREDERAVGWLVRELQSKETERAAAGVSTLPPPSSGAPTLEALATVSHELRSPLQTITSAVYLLRRAIPENEGVEPRSRLLRLDPPRHPGDDPSHLRSAGRRERRERSVQHRAGAL